MVEYDLTLFVGCRDGSIRALRFSDTNEDVLTKRFYPHTEFGIKRMMINKSILLTHA